MSGRYLRWIIPMSVGKIALGKEVDKNLGSDSLYINNWFWWILIVMLKCIVLSVLLMFQTSQLFKKKNNEKCCHARHRITCNSSVKLISHSIYWCLPFAGYIKLLRYAESYQWVTVLVETLSTGYISERNSHNLFANHSAYIKRQKKKHGNCTFLLLL